MVALTGLPEPIFDFRPELSRSRSWKVRQEPVLDESTSAAETERKSMLEGPAWRAAPGMRRGSMILAKRIHPGGPGVPGGALGLANRDLEAILDVKKC